MFTRDHLELASAIYDEDAHLCGVSSLIAEPYDTLIDATGPESWHADPSANGPPIWHRPVPILCPSRDEREGNGNIYIDGNGYWLIGERFLWIDKALWDSGWPDVDMYAYPVWDPRRRVNTQVDVSVYAAPQHDVDRTDRIPTPDAILVEAEAYRAALAHLESLRKPVSEAEQDAPNRFGRGDRVEVYKGRKVPKGTYRVVSTGSGQYGPFCTLDSLDNKDRYNFVSTDNCRRVDYLSPIEASKAAHPDLPDHVHGMLTAVQDQATLLALVDALTDLDRPIDRPHLRHLEAYARTQ